MVIQLCTHNPPRASTLQQFQAAEKHFNYSQHMMVISSFRVRSK